LSLALVVLVIPAAAAPGDDSVLDKVDESIRRGMEFLIRTQNIDGSWDNYSSSNNIGQTALSALALAKAGLEKEHPSIRKAVNFLHVNPPVRTYDVSAFLMLLDAAYSPEHEDLVRDYAEMLLQTQKGSLWSYPQGAVDMSNTQYAVMGLRSAAARGVKTGREVWTDLADKVVDCQYDDGGWGYRVNSKPTGAMTCAGLTCLLVCKEIFEKEGFGKKSISRIDRSLARGLDWMDLNFRCDVNPKPYSDPKNYRWTYYYLYGVERIGILSRRVEFGRSNWYDAGSEWLIKKQGKDGNWSSAYGESDMNTAFALLFLSRATAASGSVTRSGELSRVVTKGKQNKGEADIEIECDRTNPGHVWIGSWSKKVADKFGVDGGDRVIRVEKVEYYAGDELLVCMDTDPSGKRVTLFPFEYEFDENGDYKLSAKVTCLSTHGTIKEVFESNALPLFVHNVFMDSHLEEMDCVADNLMSIGRPGAEASSSWSGSWSAGCAVDGLHGSAWLSKKADQDSAPWIEVTPDKAVRANMIKVAHAGTDPFKPDRYGRSTKLLVTLNRGAQKVTADLGVEEKVRYSIPFKAMRIREIRIEMIDRVEGKEHAAAGFSEIELFYKR